MAEKSAEGKVPNPLEEDKEAKRKEETEERVVYDRVDLLLGEIKKKAAFEYDTKEFGREVRKYWEQPSFAAIEAVTELLEMYKKGREDSVLVSKIRRGLLYTEAEYTGGDVEKKQVELWRDKPGQRILYEIHVGKITGERLPALRGLAKEVLGLRRRVIWRLFKKT